MWDVLEAAGIWREVGLSLTSFVYCGSSSVAEPAVLNGDVDFISGNHITPYTQFAKGKPIVYLASPRNACHDKVISREPITSLADLRGLRLADTALEGADGGFAHPRGDHMLYLKRAGVAYDTDVQWLELADEMSPQFMDDLFASLQDGRADAAFVSGGTDKYEKAGLHVHTPEPLPMINGPTLTSNTDTLRKRPGLAERLVKALVLGIHFVHTRPEETNRILEAAGRGNRAANLARAWTRKPYPAIESVANAFELACMKSPETRNSSPMGVWDLHYLRELDDTGFIDRLYQESPAPALAGV